MIRRPRLNIPLSHTDKIIEYGSWALLALVWIIFLAKYPSLPETIAVHFNIDGTADHFGSKSNLILMPAITSAVCGALFFLGMFPHHFNYPVKISEENAVRQYTIALKTLRWLRVSIACVTLLITWEVIRIASSGSDSKSWLLPLTLVLIFAPIIYFLYLAIKNK
jgi:uncharacterized membrane protein